MLKADSEETERNPWTTLSSDTRYDNNWITVTEHQVRTPAQSQGIYGTVHFKHLAVGIVPIDSAGFTWLVGQYRYPLKAWSWEIPEGGGNLAVAPIETAKRELKEETGFGARRLQLVRPLTLSPSYMEFAAHLVLAEDLYPERLPGDEPEEIDVVPWKLADLHELMLRDDCSEGRSLAALFIVREVLARRAAALHGAVA